MILIERLKLLNLLSFGPAGIDLELRDLNVLIGTNGSGKTNFIEGLGLLTAIPRDLNEKIREAGGVSDLFWLGRGQTETTAVIEAFTKCPIWTLGVLKHLVKLRMAGQHYVIDEEEIVDAVPCPGKEKAKTYYSSLNGAGFFYSEQRQSQPQNVDRHQSILAQRWDPAKFKEITYLFDHYRESILIYRDWTFGKDSPCRSPQRTDLRTDRLEFNGRNLVLVLNRLRLDSAAKAKLIEHMRDLLEGLVDFEIKIEGGTARLFLDEGKFLVPSERLSDGTLRYLCLLAILLDPKPWPVICIDEPELGLHPDLVVKIAKLLIEASERTQIIVTTHSDILVDSLSHRPEDVVICERDENGSHMRRLDKKSLKKWLKEYSLGDLWSSGQIGGNRW